MNVLLFAVDIKMAGPLSLSLLVSLPAMLWGGGLGHPRPCEWASTQGGRIAVTALPVAETGRFP
ncbi:hypothetical protein ACFO4E_10885 [Nocardiopsis mangrovi]|uniref:Uncharacterized protein n=1 Tax=Nocardiopsis mangrovi TaxID=1179818 RepID=A0ABV9DUD8_9ACTN